MAKKKREHIVFDQMLKPKKSIPFSMVNKQSFMPKVQKEQDLNCLKEVENLNICMNLGLRNHS